jgi:hypothetical protein
MRSFPREIVTAEQIFSAEVTGSYLHINLFYTVLIHKMIENLINIYYVVRYFKRFLVLRKMHLISVLIH